jgi:nicotinate-nucleotide adenylyltransferase
MVFFRRAEGTPGRLAILSSAFHPVTRAHMALAQAALTRACEVLFVLPRVQPHKSYDDVILEDRLRIVLAATAHDPRFSVAVSDGGLFIEIARECRPHYPPNVQLAFVCGADTAERILNWDYGEPGAVAKQLEEFELWVADRGVRFEPPQAYRDRVSRLEIPPAMQTISSTEVRRRIAAGQDWQSLVPNSTRALVREIYRA